ncbi:MAG: family 43 glycosylhydrolase, partial [Prevotella sp.]|nr:family 43 glycosylhydrolase [Prevotella sp.]
MKRFFLTPLLLLSMQAMAQNPVIRDLFSADPTARVFKGKVYLYPSHDILVPESQRQDWFCMEDYHVFSSENLTDWTDHGMVITQNKVPWVQPDSYSMWAPDCVEKNGKYYFYFPSAPKGGRGFAIGVATADNPEGPFTCEPEPIKGVSGIDPCVLVDDNGEAYIYWSGMGIRGAKLKNNMKETDGEMQEMTMPQRPGGNTQQGAPTKFMV